jgi:sec-independent protein translocase protein TatC
MLASSNEDKLTLSEHIEEFWQRALFCTTSLILVTFICFINVQDIVDILQAPAHGVKFLQLAPGEYFFASFKISLFSGILINIPNIVLQFLLYLAPGLTKRERNLIIPVSLGSGLLFFFGLFFAYLFLIPAALNFFLLYGSKAVEPFWSFNQYIDFIEVLMFSTGLVFQIPALQVILGLLGIVSGKQMLFYWKYVVIICTIISAVITPSTDPITQILMSSALLMLYVGGSGFVILLKNEVL